MSLDPNNPRILFATIWQARRTFWSIDSGGPDSGLWRSRDGGDTWEDISRRPGLPAGTLGKIGVAVSPAPLRPGLRHDRGRGSHPRPVPLRRLRRDVGAGRRRQPDLGWRPWYYEHVIAHPTDADTVFVMNMRAWKSTDGGKNFEEFHTPHGDNHALWIDPNEPGPHDRLRRRRRLGVAQRRSLVVDDLQPADRAVLPRGHRRPVPVPRLRLAAGQLAASRCPAAPGSGAITWGNCYAPGTAESGYVAPEAGRPEHRLRRRDRQLARAAATRSSATTTARSRSSSSTCGPRRTTTARPPRCASSGPTRSCSRPTTPTCSTPPATRCSARPTRGTAGRRSAPTSPTPTRTRSASSGPLTMDTAGAEMYATVFSLMVSAHERGVLMAGSDDGLVHVTTERRRRRGTTSRRPTCPSSRR